MPIVPDAERPAIRLLPDFEPHEFGGKCARCKNLYDRLYYRKSAMVIDRLCVHCIELEATDPKRRTGRGGARDGGDVARPYNQPRAIETHGASMDICPWCGNYARPKYGLLDYRFKACGWACAGQWMDWVMDEILGDPWLAQELAEGEEYVRRSLGLIP